MGLNNPKWWYRILQIDHKRVVQCNLESVWGLAVAGWGNSDGLSEKSIEIVVEYFHVDTGISITAPAHKAYLTAS